MANYSQMGHVMEMDYVEGYSTMTSDGYQAFMTMPNSDFYWAPFNQSLVHLTRQQARGAFPFADKFFFLNNTKQSRNVIRKVRFGGQDEKQLISVDGRAMTKTNENITLENWISFEDQNELQTPHCADGEIIYDLQAGKAGLLINSSRAVYMWTWDEDEQKMSSCANANVNQTDILRFYVSDKAYLETLGGKQFQVRPNEKNASQCDVVAATFSNTTCEGYDVKNKMGELVNF